jgi:hypothetical protein
MGRSKADRNALELLRNYMSGSNTPADDFKFDRHSGLTDLHWDDRRNPAPGKSKLEEQLSLAEQAIDRALLANLHEVRLIHGLGSGKLKEAIHRMLREHPHVRSFTDVWHPNYGNGSTLVKLR